MHSKFSIHFPPAVTALIISTLLCLMSIVCGFTALHTNFSFQTGYVAKGLDRKTERWEPGGFTGGRVIILIHLQHGGLVAAASITVCLLRLLEVSDRDTQSAQQHPYPKAP